MTSWDHKPLEQLAVDGQSVDPGSDGHFEIERRGYMHSVLVSAKGYAPLTRALPSSDEGEEKNAALAEVDLGEIVLGAGRTVSGNVVDATRNQPAAGATVRVVSGTGVMDRADFGLRRGGPAQTRADAQGHYTLQVDEGDTYLEASDGRHRSSVQAIARGQEVADFRLEEGASLSGRVTGANGAPLAGTMVVAAGKESSGRATTDASGHFEINGLSEGDYGVTASGPSSGNAATAFKRVHVPGSGSVSVDLKPEGSTTLDVHVSGGGGGLIILVLTGGDGAKGVDGMQTQSCQSGAACQVEGVAPGPHLLTVKQGEASASQSVDVQGAGTQVVTVTVK